MKVAFDGVGNESSAIAFPVKIYTVKSLEIVTPVISMVVNDRNHNIPRGGSTTATTVILHGTASFNQRVQIYNGTTPLEIVRSDAGGRWRSEVAGLTMTTHTFMAKGLYGAEPESESFAIKVVAVVRPTISSVVDDKGVNIPNGGVTTATTITLRGTASVRQLVEIRNGSTLVGTVTSNDSGAWHKELPGLARTDHTFTAKGLYDDDPESLPYTVKVLDQQGLPTPVVPQAQGTGTLDLATFAGDASVTVTPWQFIATGQRYWIKVSGTLESGAPHSFYVAQNQVVTAGEVVAGLSNPMLRTALETLRHDSALTVEVRVAFDGAASEANAQLFPALVLRLMVNRNFAAPTVLEAEGNELDPINVPDGATVRVAYQGMLPNDTLTVSWLDEETEETYETDEKNGSALGEVDFTIPANIVAGSAGQPVKVFYTVVRNSNSYQSEPLELTVKTYSLIEDFENVAPGTYRRLVLPAMTIESSIDFSISSNINYPPYVVGRCIHRTGQGSFTWNITLKQEARAIIMGVSGASHGEKTLICYDEHNTEVFTNIFGGCTALWQCLLSRDGKKIKRIQISHGGNNTTAILDNIELLYF
ncbi:hypothetical protein D3C77_300140 [compost metagenome]